jgi:transposase-like protein
MRAVLALKKRAARHYRIKSFADRQMHINGIENFWNQAKRHMRRFNGFPSTLPALFEGMRMVIQQHQPKITAKPIEFNWLKQYLAISYLLLIWLFQQSPIGCGSGFSGRL